MTDITITLGSRPELDAEARRDRAIRAREVLAGAEWVFEEASSALLRDLLGTEPSEAAKREAIYLQIDAASQMRARLRQIVDTQAFEEKVNERKHRHEPLADAE